ISAVCVGFLLSRNVCMDLFHVNGLDLRHQLLQLTFCQCPGLGKKQNLFTKHHQGGNGTNVQRTSQLGLVFSGDLGECGVFILGSSLVKNRREVLAGPAPGRPEIDNDGRVALYGGLEAVFIEFDRTHEYSVGCSPLAGLPAIRWMKRPVYLRAAGRCQPCSACRCDPLLDACRQSSGNAAYLMTNSTATTRVAG